MKKKNTKMLLMNFFESQLKHKPSYRLNMKWGNGTEDVRHFHDIYKRFITIPGPEWQWYREGAIEHWVPTLDKENTMITDIFTIYVFIGVREKNHGNYLNSLGILTALARASLLPKLSNMYKDSISSLWVEADRAAWSTSLASYKTS